MILYEDKWIVLGFGLLFKVFCIFEDNGECFKKLCDKLIYCFYVLL